MKGKMGIYGLGSDAGLFVKVGLIFLLLFILGSFERAEARSSEPAASREERITELEKTVQKLMVEIKGLQNEQREEKVQREKQEKEISTLETRIEEAKEDDSFNVPGWINRFNFSGYGEMHANFSMDDGPDKFDIHRLVLNVGYQFTDWIRFKSEVEIEHAFVSDDSGGYLAIEQAYVEFLLSEYANITVGRTLTPLGIINQKHEPTSFNGVERPAFDKYIIPTTWSSDGIGVFGNIGPSLKYQAYLVGGLDGSKFNAIDGIRKGRIKERPSLRNPAITGKLDYYPFAERATTYGQMLRVGASTYHGGLNNSNNGKSSGIDGTIHIYSGDFEYSILDFDFRGAIAFEKIDGAEQIGNGAASEIFGWYMEGGYHFFLDSWKKGLLSRADSVFFVRYDYYNTQYKMPQGVAENPAGDRNDWTMGISFFPIPILVIKADYQIRNNATDQGVENLFNLGVGFQF